MTDETLASPAGDAAPRRSRRAAVCAILTLIGLPAYVGCAILHVCMDGHMRHPPYGPVHFALDWAWVVPFAAVIVFSIHDSLGRPRILPWCLLALAFSRATGSGGGMSFVFELVLALAAVVSLPLLRRIPARPAV